MRTLRPSLGISWLVIVLCGCGGGSEQPLGSLASTAPSVITEEDLDGNEESPSQAESPSGVVLASATDEVSPQKKIGGLEFDDDENVEEDEEDTVNTVEPIEGSPDWMIREITKLRIEPFPGTEDLEKLREARNKRNEKIIEMTTQVIEQTHKNKKQERIFDVAVHYRLEARLQLAMQGDRESVDVLYDDAAWLWERNRNSKSAADGAFTLVNLAYDSAKKTSPKDLKWLKEFTRLANHFLVNFPKEQRRSIPLVFTAARSCELHGLIDEAAKSYAAIKTTFPESDQAQRVTGILRRLNLKGEPLQLGGPTLDGNHVASSDFTGKVTVVVFWSEQAKPFLDDLSRLKDLERRFAQNGVALVGVCLDSDQEAASKFVKTHEMNWPQIFYTEEGKTGWNNPIANYYGLMEVGHWLVDPKGRVVSTTLKATELEANILPLLERGARRKP